MLELGAVYRVGEVGMRVDVHDVDHAVRLGHAAAHREADRVVAADRHHHRAPLRDLARGRRGPRLAERHIAAGDENIPAIREPNTFQVVALGFDVEPAGAGSIGAAFTEPGAGFANETRPGEGPRPDEGNDHPLVGRHAQERNPGVEPVEVIDRRGAEEGPRRRSRQWADWLFRIPRHPHSPRMPASIENRSCQCVCIMV